MNKVIFILFIGFFLILTGCHRNEEVLTQPVDSVNYTITKSYEVTLDQWFTRYSYYYYNQDERLIRIIHKNNGQEVGETTFQYDKNGRLTEEKNNVAWGYDYIFKYDDEGRLIYQWGTNQHKIIYDSIGRVMKLQYLGGAPDYPVDDEVVYRYDSIDIWKINEEIRTSASSGEVYYDLKYYYNDKDQLYEKSLVDGVSWLIPGPWEQFEYNPDGKLSKKIKYERNITDYAGIVEEIKYFYF